MEDEEKVIEFALVTGKLLLENGAEIFRVEETIDRICSYYQVNSLETFVLSNGIFITYGQKKGEVYAKVKHIPVSATHLDIVVAINQLSRDIVRYQYSLEEAKKQLEMISQLEHYPAWIFTLASGLGSGAFCYLFGGSLLDATVAFLAGFLLYLYVLLLGKYLSKIPMNIIGGFLVCFLCGLIYHANSHLHLSYMVIGSIMPLIPGVAFINSIREIANEDYLSGTVKMLDALVVFISIALGVGFAISVLHFLFGGFLL